MTRLIDIDLGCSVVVVLSGPVPYCLHTYLYRPQIAAFLTWQHLAVRMDVCSGFEVHADSIHTATG